MCALRFTHRTRLSSNGETSKFNSSKAEKDLRDNTKESKNNGWVEMVKINAD